MAHLPFRVPGHPARHRPDGVSRALAAYVLVAGMAAAAAATLLAQDPRLASEAAPVPPPMVFLLDAVAAPEAIADAQDARGALARQARNGDPQAELALGRLLADDAKRGHDLGRVSDAALWLDRARRHGRTEAALDLAELADRYCSRHELLADRLCAGD